MHTHMMNGMHICRHTDYLDVVIVVFVIFVLLVFTRSIVTADCLHVSASYPIAADPVDIGLHISKPVLLQRAAFSLLRWQTSELSKWIPVMEISSLLRWLQGLL